MENKTETLSMRISKELSQKMKTLADAINCDTSEIARRVGRYIVRHEISRPEANLTAKSKENELSEFLKVRNFPKIELDDEEFRLILEQRCDDALRKCENQSVFVTDKKEGLDYVVVEN